MVTRAELWQLTCPFTGSVFRVQFWDMHEQDRWGKRRMAVAVFRQIPTSPNRYALVMKSRHYWPGLMRSCDGPEAARDVIGFLGVDDISTGELEVSGCPNDDGAWL